MTAGKAYESGQITVFYDSQRCRHFAECVRGLPAVFDTRARPWIQPEAAEAEAVAEVIRRCPSGALHYRLEGQPEQPLPITKVMPLAGGPLLLEGDLRLVLDGVEHPETRMAACACGQSENRPFCDGACQPKR
jgi:uncharacterized Fe-S cluster protein YjdI